MNAETKFLWELCKIYRISSSKRHDVYLILGLVGAAFISLIPSQMRCLFEGGI